MRPDQSRKLLAIKEQIVIERSSCDVLLYEKIRSYSDLFYM
jgi:hypothetical protein